MYYLAKRKTVTGTGDEIVSYRATPKMSLPDQNNTYDEFWSEFLPPEGYDPLYHQLYRGRNTEYGYGCWTIEMTTKQKYVDFEKYFRESGLYDKATSSLNFVYLPMLLTAIGSENRNAKYRRDDFGLALQRLIDGFPALLRLTNAQLVALNAQLTACYLPNVTAVTLL